jgi:hypothetical protein
MISITPMISEFKSQLEGIDPNEEEVARKFLEYINFSCLEFPNGAYNPRNYADKLSDEWYENEIKSCRKFYERLSGIFGNTAPKIFIRLKKDFEKNVGITYKLLDLRRRDYKGELSLQTHKFFPWCVDFDRASKTVFKYGRSFVDLEKLCFTDELIGSGGLANIYKVESEENHNYAFKLFHPDYMFSRGIIEERQEAKYEIEKNLLENIRIFNQEPFTKLRGISTGREYSLENPLYLLMDFAEGESLLQLIQSKSEILNDREIVGKIFLTYANMLKGLHNKGLIFVDNNPGAIIVGKEKVRICDYDFVRPKGKSCSFRASYYFSREQLLFKRPLTEKNDLQGFARIIDEICMQGNLCELYGSEYREQVKNDNYEYPPERVQKLPLNLRKVIPIVLTYPHTNHADSISIDDFVSAIREDYKL